MVVLKNWTSYPILLLLLVVLVAACGGGEDGPTAAIYVMNANGSGQQALTNGLNGLAYDFFPAWSPDGSKIAFSSRRAGDWEIWEIYVMDAHGGNKTRLLGSQGRDESPSWSPDVERYTSWHPTAPTRPT